MRRLALVALLLAIPASAGRLRDREVLLAGPCVGTYTLLRGTETIATVACADLPKCVAVPGSGDIRWRLGDIEGPVLTDDGSGACPP